MSALQDKPVIVSSSMTGLLISHSLSKSGIDHVVLGGGEPNDLPRLGESVNENASVDFWRLLGPEFKEYFYTKSHISLFNGDVASMIQIANPARSIDHISCRGDRVNFRKAVGTLIHADRIGLDKALYHKVRESPHCTFVEAQAEVTYDPAMDTVTRLELSNGDAIDHPPFVFDGTAFKGVVAKAAGVGQEAISAPERVVWTHYQRDPVEMQPQIWWLYGTNLLKLTRERDGFDGISWFIPLGDTVSLGVSVDGEEHTPERMSKEEVMGRLDEAWQRRGVDYRSLFPKTRPIMDVTHRYFIRDRGYGKNWLLAGGGFVQIWFPSSAGLWTALVAARLAPKFINGVEGTGKLYEDTLRPLLEFHELLRTMIKGRPMRFTHQMYEFWSRWLAYIPGRMATHFRICNDELDSDDRMYRVPEAMTRTFKKHWITHLAAWGFVVTRARRVPDLGQQAESFPNYFDRWKFARRNYLQGWPKFLASKALHPTARI